MLERIEKIQGIGLLHNANGAPYTCQKATLIYADNGRGKSTLARILRSSSTGEVGLVANSKTVDGTLPSKVILQFNSGHKVLFERDTWSEHRPEILVFDADFIDRNVHSGGFVNTDHRKNLLEFALGEPAVAARRELEKATESAKVGAAKVQGISDQLSGFHPGMSLQEFENLQTVLDADEKLAALQTRLSSAKNSALILSKILPTEILEPEIKLDELFRGFANSLTDIHAEAEELVRDHIFLLNSPGAETWLSQGTQLPITENCPYCGQDIGDNKLIAAYQIHFNEAYKELKVKVSRLVNTVKDATDSSVVSRFFQAAKTAHAQASAWAEYVQIAPTNIDFLEATGAMAELNGLLLSMAMQKQASPAEPIGSPDQKDQAEQLWNKVITPMRLTNQEIKSAAAAINVYKGKLAAESTQRVQEQLQRLEISIQRNTSPVIELLTQLLAARTETAAASEAKRVTRENLDTLMTTALTKYEGEINSLLEKFGASFKIKGMGANFRGSGPRSDYGIEMRGKDVSVGGGAPSFATALSEGDKRTLAFAFFVASTLTDAKLATRIVVVDDPMCSLDVNRRHHTRVVLQKIYSKAEQLIVLAHDVYFLRDLRDKLEKETCPGLSVTFQLTSGANGYTQFDKLDVDRACESVYFRHRRLLNEFAEGKGGDLQLVAKAIRPMLEGYLHNRFPGLVPKGQLFGQIIGLIKGAVTPSPLCHAKGIVTELNEINDYAGQFHHDTNPSASSSVVVAAELATYVTRAIMVIYRG